MRLVLLGPPGAGKGTQARHLAERFGATIIATGDMFRRNVAEGTELGLEAKRYMDAGELVPDDVTIGMVRAAVARAGDGFILDGFPRTTRQAEALDSELDALARPLTAALAFEVSEEVAVRRIAGRRTCSICQTPSNVYDSPTRVEGVCDVCGGRLVQRTDEGEEVVRRRLEVYRESTAPLLDYYAGRGVLVRVDAEAAEHEVTERAVHALQMAAA